MVDSIRNHKGLLATYIGACAVDLLCSILTFESVHAWHASWTPQSIWTHVTDFRHDCFDQVLMTLFRISACSLLGWYAARVGVPEHLKASIDSSETQGDAPKRKQSGHDDHGMDEPLLDPSDDRGRLVSESHLSVNVNGSSASSTLLGSSYVRAPLTEEEKIEVTRTADRRRHTCLALAFVIMTWGQIQTGIKMVTFSFPDGVNFTVCAVLMGSTIAWINLEMSTLRSLVDKVTRDQGVLFRELHAHRLRYNYELAGHWCDLCRDRISKPGVGYTCRECDFDLCLVRSTENVRSSSSCAIIF